MKYFILVLVFHFVAIHQIGFGKALNLQEQSFGESVYNLTNESNHHENTSYAGCKCDKGVCVYEGEREVCKCPPGFGNYTRTRCEECNCGPDVNCIFTRNYGGKVCLCNRGYLPENGKCVDCVCEHGKCMEEEGKTICKCPLEFGNYYANKCEDCECGRGYSCIWDQGLFSRSKNCFCKSGYIEKDKECIGPCSPNPCENGGLCIDRENGGYECLCPSKYTGKNCTNEETRCRWDTCNNGGECVEYSDMSYSCKCRDTFKGKHCEFTKSCSRDTCKNSGQCLENIDSSGYTCKCIAMFKGKNCEFPRSCRLDTCKNGGYCIENIDSFGYTCKCTEMFKGKNCEFKKRCQSYTCKNGGTCEEDMDSSSYYCNCAENYKGNFCQYEKSDPCHPNPCQNGGRCGKYGNNYICKCFDPWTGNNCEKKKHEPCESNPCKNGGSCGKSGNNYICKCVDPWEGKDCGERKHNPCDSSPCQNEGSCLMQGNDYICVCNDFWTGSNCEKKKHDPCDSNPCQNGGSCGKSGNNYICKCVDPWEGKDCGERKHNPCDSYPCQNEGSCLMQGNDYLCVCNDFWTGRHCEEIAKCSKDEDCKDNQKCRMVDGLETCVCADGLSGENCEVKEWCEEKFPNCKGENGTCDYFKAKRSVDCICPPGKKLHPYENRCRDSCTYNYECENLGICDGNFCSCRSGLMGDKCEKVFDCTADGSFRGCEISGGNCIYNITHAVCKCPDNKKYHDNHHYCEECICGQAGTCKFANGYKVCACTLGYVDFEGTCTECNCGPYGTCHFKFGQNQCDCHSFATEKNGVCVVLETTSLDETTVTFSTIHPSTIQDICNEYKCVHGICEVIGESFRCRCSDGFTGQRCEVKIQIKQNNLWWILIACIILAIFILLSGVLCSTTYVMMKTSKK